MAGDKKDALERAQAEDRALRASVDKLLTLEEGQRVFKFLFTICGWAQADVPVDKLGKVESGTLTYNATRRTIYARLRSKATKSLLYKVEEAAELLAQQGAEEEGTSQEEKA